MEEYIEIFEFVSLQVPKLSEEQYVGYFIGGLRMDLRQRVHTHRPESRWQVMQLARDIEAESGSIECVWEGQNQG